MKRVAIYLTISHIALTCGVGVSSLWNWYKGPLPQTDQISVRVDLPAKKLPAQTNVSTPVTPHSEVVFGKGRLRIITHQLRLESDRLHYQINVSYPEIVGSKDRHIQNLNRQIERLVTRRYEWAMNPSEAERYEREKPPEFYNTVDIIYEVRFASDSLLSIYFGGYSYTIGAAHAVQYSFTVNYDLTLRKELDLPDIFKPNSKYLKFIEHYCTDELANGPAGASLFNEAFAPPTKAFESWNITTDGIIFNFDQCRVTGCSAGEQAVEIPFSALKPLLNSRARGIAHSRSN